MVVKLIKIDILGNVNTVWVIEHTKIKRERKKQNMKNNYKIEKDPYLNKYVVWEVHINYKVEVYRNRLKRLCTEWVKENEG